MHPGPIVRGWPNARIRYVEGAQLAVSYPDTIHPRLMSRPDPESLDLDRESAQVRALGHFLQGCIRRVGGSLVPFFQWRGEFALGPPRERSAASAVDPDSLVLPRVPSKACAHPSAPVAVIGGTRVATAGVIGICGGRQQPRAVNMPRHYERGGRPGRYLTDVGVSGQLASPKPGLRHIVPASDDAPIPSEAFVEYAPVAFDPGARPSPLGIVTPGECPVVCVQSLNGDNEACEPAAPSTIFVPQPACTPQVDRSPTGTDGRSCPRPEQLPPRLEPPQHPCFVTHTITVPSRWLAQQPHAPHPRSRASPVQDTRGTNPPRRGRGHPTGVSEGTRDTDSMSTPCQTSSCVLLPVHPPYCSPTPVMPRRVFNYY